MAKEKGKGKEIEIYEQLKKVKGLPFEEVLKLANEVRKNAGITSGTPESWQIFSFVTQMGLALNLDIRVQGLTTTIKNLDKRNRALQIAVLALGFVTAFSAFYQFLKDWLNPYPLSNFLISLGVTFLLATIMYVWLKKK